MIRLDLPEKELVKEQSAACARGDFSYAPALPDLEQRYQDAKARLLIAQAEKAAAAAEFMAARAALHRLFETIWPERG